MAGGSSACLMRPDAPCPSTVAAAYAFANRRRPNLPGAIPVIFADGLPFAIVDP
jgi:hypothetical protein